MLIPAGIGTRPPRALSAGRISAAGCYGDLVTLEPTGVVLIRPGARLLTADLFRAWGQPLSARRLLWFRASRGAACRGVCRGAALAWASRTRSLGEACGDRAGGRAVRPAPLVVHVPAWRLNTVRSTGRRAPGSAFVPASEPGRGAPPRYRDQNARHGPGGYPLMAGAILSRPSPDAADSSSSRRRRSRIAVLGGRGGPVVLLAVAASLFAFVGGARADGDPASDYLVSRQVFVSSQQGVESSAQRELLATVAAANRAGFAIRVAIISSDYDLGSITALWRKPALYARFLGLELAPAYRGRLLVVMPNGFGLSWPGHPPGPEQEVLANVPTASGQAGLLSAAQTAVRRLAAAEGIAAVSARAASVHPAGANGNGSVSATTVAAAVAALAVLAGGLLVLARRRAARISAPGTRGRASTRPVGRVPLGVAVPGCAALCAVAVGAPILILHGTRHRSGPSAAQLASVVTPPPVSWPAGRRPAPGFRVARSGRPPGLRRGLSRPAGDRDLHRSSVPESVPA